MSVKRKSTTLSQADRLATGATDRRPLTGAALLSLADAANHPIRAV